MISYSHPKLFPSTSTSLYKTILLLLNIVIAAAISVDSVQAQSKDDLQELIRASKTRAALVQNVKQAVVHIKVEKEITNTGRNTPNNPRDLYNDEFFERFFPGMRPPRDQGNDRFRQEGMGSGSIVRSDGFILTNHHVVGEADKITVQLFDGRELEAKLIGTDPESDISVIKVDEEGMPTLVMGDSKEILVGESVIAVGNPFGLTQTVTFGIVSAKGRTGIGITEYEDFIQTDAAINPGNLLSAPLSLCTVKDLLTLSGCGSDRRLRRFLDLQLRLYSQQPADQTAALYGATVLQMCQAPLGLWHLHGSMQVLSERLASGLQRDGGTMLLRHRVQQLQQNSDGSGWQLLVEGPGRQEQIFGAGDVISTLPPQCLPGLISAERNAEHNVR